MSAFSNFSWRALGLRVMLTCMLAGALSTQSFSSHILGGELTSRFVSPGQLEVTLKLYSQCLSVPMGNQNLTLTGFGGWSTFQSIPNIPDQYTGNTWTDITQVCSADSLNTECYGGTLPSLIVYLFMDTITVPTGGNVTVEYTHCCRATTNNVPGTNFSNFYLESQIDPSLDPANSNPTFDVQPTLIACVNQPLSHDLSTTDVDGDSLSYELIATRSTNGNQLAYAAGYSYGTPIGSASLHPATGFFTALPTVIGAYVIVYEVHEWDSNGNLKGITYRDQILFVNSCSNQIGSAWAAFDSVYAPATMQGPYHMSVCPGNTGCFSLTFEDPDAGDTLYLSHQITTQLPGASVIVTGLNPMTVEVCWTPTANDLGSHYLWFNFTDGVCPIPGDFVHMVEFEVGGAINVGPDVNICPGDNVTLDGSDGNNPTWSVLYGDPMVIGTNFSCNNCPNPVASPAITTTYVVDGNLGAGCSAMDTITVWVDPLFSTSTTATPAYACMGDTITMNITPAGAGYTYHWAPLDPLDSLAISSNSGSSAWLVAGNTPGYYGWAVTITNANGCSVTDTVGFNINPLPGVGFTQSADTVYMGNGTTVSFQNQTVDLNGNTYDWDFGDGNNATSEHPDHTFTTAGTYEVKLTVTTGNQCMGSSADTVWVFTSVSALEQPTQRPIRFFPNPAASGQEMRYVGTDGLLELWDLNGKLVKSYGVIQDGGMITLPELAAGTYNFVLTDDQNRQTTSIVVLP